MKQPDAFEVMLARADHVADYRTVPCSWRRERFEDCPMRRVHEDHAAALVIALAVLTTNSVPPPSSTLEET